MRDKNKQLLVICAILALVIAFVGYSIWKSPSEDQYISSSQISEYKYVASSLREPFHKPSCKWVKKISPENLIGFKTRQEALDSGRRPCKVCRP